MNESPNAASVAIFSHDEVLLIKRAREPFAQHWTLPGGRREADETIEDCARREVREELRLDLGPLLPVMQFAVMPGFELAVFAIAWRGQVPAPNDEIADWRWTGFSDLSGIETTPRLEEILMLAHRSLNKN